MNRIFGKSVVVLGVLGIMTMGCGDDGKDTGDTGSTSTSTSTTGTTTGTTTTPETTGFTRLVHLIADVPEIDVFLFDDPAPLGTFPIGGNSDAEGTGYLPFPPMDYTVRATNTSTGEELVLLETALAVSERKTLIFHGSVFAGQMSADLGPSSLVIDDSQDPADAGMHRLTIYHLAPGVGPLGLTDGTSTIAGTSYLGWETLTVASGDIVIGTDMNGDGASDLEYAMNVADAGWSYAYILPSETPGEPGTMLHHVLAETNVPLLPTPVMQ